MVTLATVFGHVDIVVVYQLVLAVEVLGLGWLLRG